VRPGGGYQLWIELPKDVDAMALHARALEYGISLAPGPMFSPRREFSGAIRLNYGHPWSDRTERAIGTLGKLISGAL
jgi:DNA-binding transcriptional MocR family regulator